MSAETRQALLSIADWIDNMEKQINENTKAATGGQQVIQGITGTQYTPQIFEGPSGIPRKAYPDSEAQQ